MHILRVNFPNAVFLGIQKLIILVMLVLVILSLCMVKQGWGLSEMFIIIQKNYNEADRFRNNDPRARTEMA